MNELTRDCAVLVESSAQGTHGLATTHQVDASHVAAAVRKVMTMDLAERCALGRAARRQWEQNLLNFRHGVQNMARIIGERLAASGSVTKHETPPSGATQRLGPPFGSNSLGA
jgi:hypothetical protein